MILPRLKHIIMMMLLSAAFEAGASPSMKVVSISIEEDFVEITAVVSPSTDAGELQENPNWNSRVGVICLPGHGSDPRYPIVANFEVLLFGSNESEKAVPVFYAPSSSVLGVYNKSVYELIFPRAGARWPQGCDPVLFKIPAELILANTEKCDRLEISVRVEAQIYTSELAPVSTAVVEGERLSLSKGIDQIENPFSPGT